MNDFRCHFDKFYKNAKKTTHSLYLKISVNDIPQKGHKIVTNFYDKNEFKIKYKPIQFLDENIVKNDSKIEIQSTDKYIVADIVDHNTFSSRNELKNKLFLKVNEIEDNLLGPPEEVIPQFSIIEEDEEDNKNKTSAKLIYISDSINNAFKYNPKIKAQEAFFNASKENYWPERLDGIGANNVIIIGSTVPMDTHIVEVLRKI